MTGIEAAPHLLLAIPTVIIILFTMYPTAAVADEAERVGIHAVMSKGTPHKLFAHARLLLKLA
jgi:hypothetical protein